MNKICSDCNEEFDEYGYNYCPYCGEKLIQNRKRETSILNKKITDYHYSNGCGFIIDLNTHWVIYFHTDYGIYSDISNGIWLDKIDYSFNDAVNYLNKNWYKLGE